MALKPAEYESLQIQEFNKMLEGYLLRQKQNHKQQAYFTACIMSCLATQAVSPEDIYYGMHPEDKPDPSKERNEFLKAVGLPPMQIERG